MVYNRYRYARRAGVRRRKGGAEWRHGVSEMRRTVVIWGGMDPILIVTAIDNSMALQARTKGAVATRVV